MYGVKVAEGICVALGAGWCMYVVVLNSVCAYCLYGVYEVAPVVFMYGGVGWGLYGAVLEGLCTGWC